MRHLGAYLKKELSRHGADYLMLIVAGLFFLLALKLFQGQSRPSLLIVFIFMVFYIMWGVQHHKKNQSVHIKNVLEYILIALIVFVFLLILFTIK